MIDLNLIQPSELQVLILGLALTPVMAWAFMGTEQPGRFWIAAAITSIMVSYVVTILEGFFWPDFFNTVEHLGLAISGFCFMMVTVNLLRWYRARAAEDPEC